MKTYEYRQDEKIMPDGCIVALGYFDGVHNGHRHLIALAKSLAKSMNLPLAVFTFHSDGTLSKGGGFLYTTEEKLTLLENLGVDVTVVADFGSVSGICAEDFIRDTLIKDLSCQGAVCGFDFRFGKGAVKDADFLYKTLSALGKRCIIAEEETYLGEKISTTRIKKALLDGEIETATKLLGAPYFLCGKVMRGDGRGHSLGFPTLNTELQEGQSAVKHGVYRSAVCIDGLLYHAITNVGTCPTFTPRTAHAETYIIDFDGDLYGKKIRIYLLGYLREEKEFSSQEELIMQINVDKNRAIKENGELKWQVIGQN